MRTVDSPSPFASGFSLLEPVLVTDVVTDGWPTIPWRFSHDVIAVNKPDPHVWARDQSRIWRSALNTFQIDSNRVGVVFGHSIGIGAPWKITGRPVCFNPRPLYIPFPQSGDTIPP